MTLKSKLFLITTAAIIVLVGVSEWITYRQTAAFVGSHEYAMRHAEGVAALANFQAGKQRLFVPLAFARALNAFVTVAALAVVLNWVWYRLVLRPIGTLLGRINRMGRGTWTERIPVARRDEIGELTEAFNQLGEQLTVTVHQFAAASKLSAIALMARRIARRAELAQIRVVGVKNMLHQLTAADQIPDGVFENLQAVAESLKEIQQHTEAEFYSQLRLHSAGPGTRAGIPGNAESGGGAAPDSPAVVLRQPAIT